MQLPIPCRILCLQFRPARPAVVASVIGARPRVQSAGCFGPTVALVAEDLAGSPLGLELLGGHGVSAEIAGGGDEVPQLGLAPR